MASKIIRWVGNLLVPFIIGWLLVGAIPISNWRFWVILALVMIYRGSRVEKIDG